MYEYIIYEIYCKATKLSYIGSTTDYESRIKGHFLSLSKNKHSNRHLQRDYNLYGKESFMCDILANCDASKKEDKEYSIISHRNPETLYNLNKGKYKRHLNRQQELNSKYNAALLRDDKMDIIIEYIKSIQVFKWANQHNLNKSIIHQIHHKRRKIVPKNIAFCLQNEIKTEIIEKILCHRNI